MCNSCFLLTASKRDFFFRISCWHESGQRIAVENFEGRRSLFPSGKKCKYIELPNMATEYPLKTQPIPIHPTKVTVWCGFTALFIMGPYFFEEKGA